VDERAEIVHDLGYARSERNSGETPPLQRPTLRSVLIDQIKQYAIHRLSTDVILSPIEKILLARAHRVSVWLDEAITILAGGLPKPKLEDLVTLGWETAARILWIRDNANTSNNLCFKRDTIKCGHCLSSSSLINHKFQLRSWAHYICICRIDLF